MHDKGPRHSRRHCPLRGQSSGLSRFEDSLGDVLRDEPLVRSPDHFGALRDDEGVPAGAEQDGFIVIGGICHGQCHLDKLAGTIRRLVGRQADSHRRTIYWPLDFGLMHAVVGHQTGGQMGEQSLVFQVIDARTQLMSHHWFSVKVHACQEPIIDSHHYSPAIAVPTWLSGFGE